MTQVYRVKMPDDTEIFARIESADMGSTGVDVRLRDHFTLENLSPTIASVAAAVHDGVRELDADKVSVEFGLELAIGGGGLVAVLASGGMKATVKVKLDWDRGTPAEGKPAEG